MVIKNFELQLYTPDSGEDVFFDVSDATIVVTKNFELEEYTPPNGLNVIFGDEALSLRYRRWDGSQWVEDDVLYFNGTEFENVEEGFIYDGTDWIKLI